ncbi:MAG: hypothetical protein NVS4B3_24650 [Gemmatimonadaceae bacterium]
MRATSGAQLSNGSTADWTLFLVRPTACKRLFSQLAHEDSQVEAATLPSTQRLSLDDREAIASFAARATWPAGFVIYQRGTAAEGIFIVIRGRVVLRCRVRAGRGFVPAIVVAGETFGSEGLSPIGRYATDARADAETETLHLSMQRFRALLREQPQRACTVVGQVMIERAALLDKLRELTTLSVEQRLLATLVRMGRTGGFDGDDGRIVLTPDRYRLLCELVGATRESVSLVLAKLVGEGLATRNGQTLVIEPPLRLAAKLENGWSDGDDILPAAAESPTQAALQPRS